MLSEENVCYDQCVFLAKLYQSLPCFIPSFRHVIILLYFIFKLKKVGKTTRPFRYDLNQIPYDYIVEVRNRFKGLDLKDRVPSELWTEVRDIVQERGS